MLVRRFNRTLGHAVLAATVLVGAGTAVAESIVYVPGDAATFQSALLMVSDGGVIEMAGGIYTAPSSGFELFDLGKSFTVRGAAGATVVLEGNGTGPVLRYFNFSPDPEQSIVFSNLEFVGGYSNENGIGGGVTISEGHATFVDCAFRNNASEASNTGGGGVFLRDDATGLFEGCEFTGNTSTNEGGGLRVGSGCHASIHGSQFVANRTDVPNHRASAAGAGIHVTNSILHVTNTRFENNVAGCVGGAVYAIGNWNDVPDEPASEIWISNSSFRANLAEPDGSVTCNQPTVGGGIHAEDDTQVRVYNSRFELNRAEMGGGISLYRADLEVDHSIFRGNLANGTDGASGSGGALRINSNDNSDVSTNYGAINRPSARAVVRQSLIVGRYGTTGPAGTKGACFFSQGDSNRSYGQGVPQMGGPELNRSVLEIYSSALVDCDAGFAADGEGGAMSLNHTALHLEDSLVLDSDALGTGGNGGALRLTYESDAVISGVWFANNTAGDRAAVMLVNGSEIAIDECTFLRNVVTSGNNGSVLWSKSATLLGVPMKVDGHVDDSTFILNTSLEIFETDNSAGPINDVTYSNNRFLSTPVNTSVFSNSVEPGGRTVAQLNALVVNRNFGVGDTDKAPANDNVALTSSPVDAALLAAPPVILPVSAPGDPIVETEAFLAWTWAGDWAELDGSPLSGDWGTGLGVTNAGYHTLDVGNGAATASVTVDFGPLAAAELTASPEYITGGESSDIGWATLDGDWLRVFLDRGIPVTAQTATGLETVSPPATTTYRAHIVTRQGGTVEHATVFVDEVPSDVIFEDGFEDGSLAAWDNSTGDGVP